MDSAATGGISILTMPKSVTAIASPAKSHSDRSYLDIAGAYRMALPDNIAEEPSPTTIRSDVLFCRAVGVGVEGGGDAP
jgi:hypothetical protein